MAVHSILIEHNGVYAGHALSLGDRFTFHTSVEELADLDEAYFGSIDALRQAVAQILIADSDDRVAA